MAVSDFSKFELVVFRGKSYTTYERSKDDY
jgi:hypothetical protein